MGPRAGCRRAVLERMLAAPSFVLALLLGRRCLEVPPPERQATFGEALRGAAACLVDAQSRHQARSRTALRAGRWAMARGRFAGVGLVTFVCASTLACSKVDRIRIRAALGNAEAEAALADMYARGEGRTRDLTEAARWFRRAAEQGNAAAQYNLGTMYANGEGVPRDRAQAARWYQKAAEQGDDDAANELGRMYWTGDGVPRDLGLAATWTQKAAEQGNKVAQFRLGIMYMGGEGVPEDRVQAHKWLELGASSGDGEAHGVLASLETKLTNAELGEAQRLAEEWRQAHADGRR